MLDELYERIDHQKQAEKWTIWHLAEDPLDIADWIREQQRKAVRYCYCQNDVLATLEAFNYYNKTNNEKEKEKMNAKRCDRCGKLYVSTDDAPIRAYLCGRVTEHEKETYLPEKNKEFNTFNIKITLNSIDAVDMCPECREKLKEFFESGAED